MRFLPSAPTARKSIAQAAGRNADKAWVTNLIRRKALKGRNKNAASALRFALSGLGVPMMIVTQASSATRTSAWAIDFRAVGADDKKRLQSERYWFRICT